MKALILAAGLGTRLLPFTEHTPKPLFTIGGCPLLDILICRLKNAGCEAVIINTHHLHEKMESFIAGRNYEIPVSLRHEPEILGTGGAIRNVADFWDARAFMVINSDIFTNTDLRKVYDFHLMHPHPATLVLHDFPELNTVAADADGLILDFRNSDFQFPVSKLTFTGIQVLDPEILNFIPRGIFSDSIAAYEKLLSGGGKIKAFVSEGDDWNDLGTPKRYKQTALEKMAEKVFDSEFGIRNSEFGITPLKGDGSDRKWYRLRVGNHSIIAADHGIRENDGTSETDAFVNIGCHLHRKGVPVPEIYLADTFSGLVFLEDLGDTHLRNLAREARNTEEFPVPSSQLISHYKSVIDILVQMSVLGAEDFDITWTYQSEYYDRELILEKECRYFVEAFLRGYLGRDFCFEDFEDEFITLADRAVAFSVNGFMHRDMQSQNIMFSPHSGNSGEFRLIDFQGGRMGPIQYDLASLLIDPYVDLPLPAQEHLLTYCIEKRSSVSYVDPEKFRIGYEYCALSRNLQMLGAFGYLSRVRGKTWFEEYIPAALKTLRYRLSLFDDTLFSKLRRIEIDGFAEE